MNTEETEREFEHTYFDGMPADEPEEAEETEALDRADLLKMYLREAR